MKNCLLLVYNLLFIFPVYGGFIEEGLKKIPISHKIFLKEFVKINFKWHQTAHVIYFDNKPVCLASAWIKSPQKPYMDVLWMRGWKAFRQYEHLFPHPNFIFKSQIDEEEDGWQAIHLFIINKRALTKCFENYLTVFQDKIGKEFSIDCFVSELEKKGSDFFNLIKKDEELLGILLGYGQESASLFKAAIANEIEDERKIQDYSFIDIKQPRGCTLFPVTFMGNPESAETKNLIAQYEQELEIFWKIYQKQEPLTLFLECICK